MSQIASNDSQNYPKQCKTKLGLKSFRLNFLMFGSRDHLVDIGHFCQSCVKTGTSFGFFIHETEMEYMYKMFKFK